MSYKNYKWEAIAHDYNSSFLRNLLWTNSIFKYPKLLGVSRPVLGIASKKNMIEYLADMSSWTKVHGELKNKVLENVKYFDDLINQTIVRGEKINNWTEKEIFNKDLSKFSGTELISLLKKFVDLQEDEYAYGVALPILDFQNFSFIEGNLNRILKEKVPEEKFQNYYSIFTEPENNSFAQDQEEDLLKLISVYWDNPDWQKSIKGEKIEDTKKIFGDFYSDLSKHTKKHCWVYYVYMGPAFTEKDFYEFVVDYVSKGIAPKEKLKELKDRKDRKVKLKEEYLKELKPTGLDEFVLKIAGRVVWAKPRRKDYQSKSYYHVEKLSKEIAKRLYVSLEQVRSAPIDFLEKALNEEIVDWTITNTIYNSHICLPNDDGSISTLIGGEAEEFSKKNIKRSKDTQDLSNVKELKGTTACIGKVTGKAKIINLPDDMIKMEQGDILVSSSTTPSIVPAMKKAAAIITDEGGLTCHAAIVSRELNIPCIVGLKVATKFVKDGEMLEVDATKAIVKKI